MNKNIKVKVINDLSFRKIDLEKIIVFCVNMGVDPKKSHDCTAMIEDNMTHMVRVERTPSYVTQVYALIHDEFPELVRWYPVTVTWSD